MTSHQVYQNFRDLFEKIRTSGYIYKQKEADARKLEEEKNARIELMKKHTNCEYTNNFLNVHNGIDFNSLGQILDSDKFSFEPGTRLPIARFNTLGNLKDDTKAVASTKEKLKNDETALKYFSDLGAYERCFLIRDAVAPMIPKNMRKDIQVSCSDIYEIQSAVLWIKYS